jgi:hypothetical protein
VNCVELFGSNSMIGAQSRRVRTEALIVSFVICVFALLYIFQFSKILQDSLQLYDFPSENILDLEELITNNREFDEIERTTLDPEFVSVFHLHVPKTAGTTLLAFLKQVPNLIYQLI